MEVNENTVLQNGKVEDEYVRIGTTLFRILNQPMMNGSFRKMRVEWKMSVFRQDHSKDEAAQIPKYDGFCTMPSHTDYRHNVNNFYNLYEPITHTPAEGDFHPSWTQCRWMWWISASTTYWHCSTIRW